MTLLSITPEKAKALIDQGAVLIDIREPDEHARERIPHAKLVPVSALDGATMPTQDSTAVIFHCRSGNRTKAHANKLASCTTCDAYVLEGGIDAWKKAGLPTAINAEQPIEIMRQVQLVAGGLVVAGVALGAWVSPGFYGLSAFVGAGLMFAGYTGTCAMARILKWMPWNRKQVF